MYKILQSIRKKDSVYHYKLAVLRFSSFVLNEDIAKRLETVSLVGFSKRSGFDVLDASVKFADRITLIDTSKVQPLITVLETWYVKLIIIIIIITII